MTRLLWDEPIRDVPYPVVRPVIESLEMLGAWLAAAGLCAAVIGGCAAVPTTSSVERAACSAVGIVEGASPGVATLTAAVANAPAIAHASGASDRQLAAASRRWVALMRQGQTAAASQELQQMEQACSRLGIWHVYH